MTTSDLLIPVRRRSLVRLFLLEAWYEFLKAVRNPGFTIPTILFPLAFYLFFGVAFGGSRSAGPVGLSTYLLATYGAFGVIGASLFGFGVTVAAERGQGWLELKRATPMPPAAYFVSKIAMAMLFSLTIVILLTVLAVTAGGVSIEPARWAGLTATLVAGSLPFCALGLLIGSKAGPGSAPAITNLIFLPMSFLSGLWIPHEGLPPLIRTIAKFLPAYHLGRLALSWVMPVEGVGIHVAALAGFTAFFLALSAIVWRRGLAIVS